MIKLEALKFGFILTILSNSLSANAPIESDFVRADFRLPSGRIPQGFRRITATELRIVIPGRAIHSLKAPFGTRDEYGRDGYWRGSVGGGVFSGWIEGDFEIRNDGTLCTRVERKKQHQVFITCHWLYIASGDRLLREPLDNPGHFQQVAFYKSELKRPDPKIIDQSDPGRKLEGRALESALSGKRLTLSQDDPGRTTIKAEFFEKNGAWHRLESPPLDGRWFVDGDRACVIIQASKTRFCRNIWRPYRGQGLAVETGRTVRRYEVTGSELR